MMKRILSASLLFAMLFSGCGSDSSSNGDTGKVEPKCAVAFTEHNASYFGEDLAAGRWEANSMDANASEPELFVLELDANGTGQFLSGSGTSAINYRIQPEIELFTYDLNDPNSTIRLLEKYDEHCYIAAWHLDMFENRKISLCRSREY